MAVTNPYQQYQQNSIMTARPEELTLMLYNGAIKFLNMAKMNIEKKEIENAHNNIIRAEDIISELMATLDMKYEISNSLYSLYDFMNYWLLQANCHKLDGGINKINDVIKLLQDLRDTWADAMKIARQSQQKSG